VDIPLGHPRLLRPHRVFYLISFFFWRSVSFPLVKEEPSPCLLGLGCRYAAVRSPGDLSPRIETPLTAESVDAIYIQHPLFYPTPFFFETLLFWFFMSTPRYLGCGLFTPPGRFCESCSVAAFSTFLLSVATTFLL